MNECCSWELGVWFGLVWYGLGPWRIDRAGLLWGFLVEGARGVWDGGVGWGVGRG